MKITESLGKTQEENIDNENIDKIIKKYKSSKRKALILIFSAIVTSILFLPISIIDDLCTQKTHAIAILAFIFFILTLIGGILKLIITDNKKDTFIKNSKKNLYKINLLCINAFLNKFYFQSKSVISINGENFNINSIHNNVYQVLGLVDDNSVIEIHNDKNNPRIDIIFNNKYQAKKYINKHLRYNDCKFVLINGLSFFSDYKLNFANKNIISIFF